MTAKPVPTKREQARIDRYKKEWEAELFAEGAAVQPTPTLRARAAGFGNIALKAWSVVALVPTLVVVYLVVAL